MTRVLLLGGTTEATAIARALASAGIDAVFSYAGRTAEPATQPLPTRIGGFGGIAGLAAYLRRERITHLLDATHPFASRMSSNAVAAATETDTPLLAFERLPWQPQTGDDWQSVPDVEAAVDALPASPARIFLAIGRQNLAAFAVMPRHFFLLRLVDAPATPLPLPNAETVVARGPFSLASDLALLQAHAITHVVTKNSGGNASRAKLDAARALALPVIMIARPLLPDRLTTGSLDDVMRWLDHLDRLGV